MTTRKKRKRTRAMPIPVVALTPEDRRRCLLCKIGLKEWPCPCLLAYAGGLIYDAGVRVLGVSVRSCDGDNMRQTLLAGLVAMRDELDECIRTIREATA